MARATEYDYRELLVLGNQVANLSSALVKLTGKASIRVTDNTGIEIGAASKKLLDLTIIALDKTLELIEDYEKCAIREIKEKR